MIQADIHESFATGDLLFHPVHGLCRIDRINSHQEAGKPVLSYSLVPKAMGRMKSRFVISAADVEISGFHEVVSRKEANKILAFLKKGKSDLNPSSGRDKFEGVFPENYDAWSLARAILFFSRDKFDAKDQRKRQQLERSARGLVGELAVVFRSSLKDTAEKIQKSLGNRSKINPLVLVALAHAGEQ